MGNKDLIEVNLPKDVKIQTVRVNPKAEISNDIELAIGYADIFVYSDNDHDVETLTVNINNKSDDGCMIVSISVVL